MIQSTDNLEATDYSHQCGDIFVKFSKVKAKNSTGNGQPTQRPKGKLSKVHAKSDLEPNDRLNDDASSDRQVNDKESTDKLNVKRIDKSNEQSNDKSTRKSIDNLIDKSNLKSTDKSTDKLPNNKNHKSNGNLIDNLKTKTKQTQRKYLKKKGDLKKESKKDNNIPSIQNRKRSDIENIFHLNSIKRVKAEMSRRPLVFCGPSGSGKSSLLKKLRNDYPDYFGFSISRKYFCLFY